MPPGMQAVLAKKTCYGEYWRLGGLTQNVNGLPLIMVNKVAKDLICIPKSL